MNDATILLRQIHPSFVQQGRVTSQAFRPTPKDENHLSVYDGDQVTPDESFRHYTESLNCQSVGVLGVTQSECTELDLPVAADPAPFPEHVVIDFSAFDASTIKKKAKLLKAQAEKRGWLFRVS